ncbi:MAG: hypothetical protein HQM10_00560 [Candidatus Riflebacteria bacterium]|nr:hypothetical protein [Candidatus Riflebacteria bacterium]
MSKRAFLTPLFIFGSTHTGVGKSSLISNWTVFLCSEGKRVALLDFNAPFPWQLRCAFPKNMQIEEMSDLSEISGANWDKFQKNLTLETSNNIVFFPCGLLKSPETIFSEVGLKSFLMYLSANFDFIIVNLPSGLKALSDARKIFNQKNGRGEFKCLGILCTGTDSKSVIYLDQLVRKNPLYSHLVSENLLITFNQLFEEKNDEEPAEKTYPVLEIKKLLNIKHFFQIPYLQEIQKQPSFPEPIVLNDPSAIRQTISAFNRKTVEAFENTDFDLEEFNDTKFEPVFEDERYELYLPIVNRLKQILASNLLVKTTTINHFIEEKDEALRVILRTGINTRPVLNFYFPGKMHIKMTKSKPASLFEIFEQGSYEIKPVELKESIPDMNPGVEAIFEFPLDFNVFSSWSSLFELNQGNSLVLRRYSENFADNPKLEDIPSLNHTLGIESEKRARISFSDDQGQLKISDTSLSASTFLSFIQKFSMNPNFSTMYKLKKIKRSGVASFRASKLALIFSFFRNREIASAIPAVIKASGTKNNISTSTSFFNQAPSVQSDYPSFNLPNIIRPLFNHEKADFFSEKITHALTSVNNVEISIPARSVFHHENDNSILRALKRLAPKDILINEKRHPAEFKPECTAPDSTCLFINAKAGNTEEKQPEKSFRKTISLIPGNFGKATYRCPDYEEKNAEVAGKSFVRKKIDFWVLKMFSNSNTFLTSLSFCEKPPAIICTFQRSDLPVIFSRKIFSDRNETEKGLIIPDLLKSEKPDLQLHCDSKFSDLSFNSLIQQVEQNKFPVHISLERTNLSHTIIVVRNVSDSTSESVLTYFPSIQAKCILEIFSHQNFSFSDNESSGTFYFLNNIQFITTDDKCTTGNVSLNDELRMSAEPPSNIALIVAKAELSPQFAQDLIFNSEKFFRPVPQKPLSMPESVQASLSSHVLPDNYQIECLLRKDLFIGNYLFQANILPSNSFIRDQNFSCESSDDIFSLLGFFSSEEWFHSSFYNMSVVIPDITPTQSFAAFNPENELKKHIPWNPVMPVNSLERSNLIELSIFQPAESIPQNGKSKFSEFAFSPEFFSEESPDLNYNWDNHTEFLFSDLYFKLKNYFHYIKESKIYKILRKSSKYSLVFRSPAEKSEKSMFFAVQPTEKQYQLSAKLGISSPEKFKVSKLSVKDLLSAGLNVKEKLIDRLNRLVK